MSSWLGHRVIGLNFQSEADRSLTGQRNMDGVTGLGHAIRMYQSAKIALRAIAPTGDISALFELIGAGAQNDASDGGLRV